MYHTKIKTLYFFFFVFITFSITNCNSSKEVSSNREFVLETQKRLENQQNKNVLYLVDGKEVDKKFALKIKPYKIKSLKILKKKEEIAIYSKKEYRGVILIKMKK